MESSESELLIFLEKGRKLPDWEDFSALHWGGNMCMLFMEESRRSKNEGNFNKWKKRYNTSQVIHHSCVKTERKKTNRVEWVYQEMIARFSNLNDKKYLKIYNRKMKKSYGQKFFDF
jgi:hypothetical protein